MELDEDFWSWVKQHIADDPLALRLKFAGSNSMGELSAAITQIECRRKFGKKLAQTLEAFPEFYFPSTLAGEQSTSDALAAYHAILVRADEPAVDFTAGLGIDALHMASIASNVLAVERQPALAEALEYNAKGLGVTNLTALACDCRDYIAQAVDLGLHFGTAFIDPARRAADGSRVFALADCEPDVVALLPSIAKLAKRLVIKMSPMLDVSHTIAELTPKPNRIIALGTPTECKELIAVVDFDFDVDQTLIEATTIAADGTASTFAFTAAQERETPMPEASAAVKPGDYVYEASPALMKTGAFKLVASRYGLNIFHANTKLFYSSELVKDFPGRAYKVEEVIPYASGEIKRFKRRHPAANVAVRNFPISADALRKKLGISDAGPLRLYGIATNAPILLLTSPTTVLG